MSEKEAVLPTKRKFWNQFSCKLRKCAVPPESSPVSLQ